MGLSNRKLLQRDVRLIAMAQILVDPHDAVFEFMCVE